MRSARAIARRCRWPPERRAPPSPTRVSSPSGSASTKPSAFAASSAARIRGRRGRRGRRRRRSGGRVSSKRTTSCVTRPICDRREARVTSRRSVPSTVTGPRRRVHEAREEGRERRLSASRRTDERRDGAAREDEVDRVKDRSVAPGYANVTPSNRISRSRPGGASRPAGPRRRSGRRGPRRAGAPRRAPAGARGSSASPA